MENDKGEDSVKVTKRNRRKVAINIKDEEPELFDKREDTASGSGKIAVVDKKMSVSSSAATTGDKKNSISGMEIDKSYDPDKHSRSQKKKLKVSVESLDKREGTENTDSKPEVSFYTISKSSVEDNPFSGGTIAPADQNNRVSSSTSTGDKKSSNSKIEASNGEMGSSMIGSLNAEVKTQNKIETAIGETGSSIIATDNTGSKKRNRQKENNKYPESDDVLGTRENTQDKTATVDQNNRVLSSSAAGVEKGSISQVEASSGKTGPSMITSLNAEVKTQNKMETAVGETVTGTNATDNAASKKSKRPRRKKMNPKSGDVPSTRENTQDKTATVDQNNRVPNSSPTGDVPSLISKIEASSGEMSSSMITNAEVKTQNKMETAEGETGLGTNATDNTASKKRKRPRSKRPKKKKINPESGDVPSTCEKTQDITATDKNNIVSSSSPIAAVTSLISKLESSRGSRMIKSLKAKVKTQNLMETAECEMGSGTNATDNTRSKKKKRRKEKNKNTESGDVLSIRENTQDKTGNVDQNNRVLSSSATGDEKSSVSKIESSSGMIGSSMITSHNPEVKTHSKMETAKGKTGSGTNVTDSTGSKKRKRRKEKTKNPESGVVLGTCENTQDKTATVDKTGSSMIASLNVETQNKMETAVGETISGPNVTDSTASKERKYWKEKNDAGKMKKKSKRPTLGEILNPRYESLEAGTSTKNLENNERQRLNENHQASSGVLSTGEIIQDTKKPLLASSTGLEREDHLKTANGEKGPSAVVDAASSTFTEVANTAETAEAKGKTSLPIKIVKQNTGVQEKKLLILDLNGLLADNVNPPPKDIMADYRIPRRAVVFKRPFLDDFLSFCFERFHVGIWSSKKMENLMPVVNYFLREFKKKLLFIWDVSKCTKSGMKTLENKHKCLVFKDLRKIWESDGPDKSWVKGRFNESNTLLLDDSPYKALLNPRHSGIFPVCYSYKNRDDNFLGPEGELQNYLEGLAASDNVKTYVEQHPFGQGYIDETHPDWTFYSSVLKRQSK